MEEMEYLIDKLDIENLHYFVNSKNLVWMLSKLVESWAEKLNSFYKGDYFDLLDEYPDK